MPALWDSKVTFVSVSQFWGLGLCSPFGCVSGSLVTPRLIASLRHGKKEKKRERNQKEKKCLLLTLKWFSDFCWSS